MKPKTTTYWDAVLRYAIYWIVFSIVARTLLFQNGWSRLNIGDWLAIILPGAWLSFYMAGRVKTEKISKLFKDRDELASTLAMVMADRFRYYRLEYQAEDVMVFRPNNFISSFLLDPVFVSFNVPVATIVGPRQVVKELQKQLRLSSSGQ